MTPNEFNRKLRTFISYEISAANKSIKSFETKSRKVEEVEKCYNRIGAILDFCSLLIL